MNILRIWNWSCLVFQHLHVVTWQLKLHLGPFDKIHCFQCSSTTYSHAVVSVVVRNAPPKETFHSRTNHNVHLWLCLHNETLNPPSERCWDEVSADTDESVN